MNSLFAITVASKTVSLDSQNHAQTTFTVSNLSNRALNSRAILYTQDPAVASWLQIIGETEVYLPIASNVQFVVNLTVPLLAPAGSYSFRLDMVDVSNPDESFTQGPTVTFIVPSIKVNKPRFYIWVLLVAVGIIILLVVAYVALIVTTNP